MNSQRLKLEVTLAKASPKKTRTFFAKAQRIVSDVCPGTAVDFDQKTRRLTVTGIRNFNGVQFTKVAVVSLAEGMDVGLADYDFDLHHIAS
ncbi:MAG: hypothetical protein AAB891_01695 [Patescibacteria group bacterium]